MNSYHNKTTVDDYQLDISQCMHRPQMVFRQHKMGCIANYYMINVITLWFTEIAAI